MPEVEDDHLPKNGEEAIAVAAVTGDRLCGATYEDLAGRIGITPEGLAAMIALQVEALRADLARNGFDPEPPARLMLTLTTAGQPFGEEPEMLANLILDRVAGLSYTELDAALDGGSGIAATLIAVAAQSLEDDLMQHGFEPDSLEALQAAYDVQMSAPPLRH